MSGFNLPDDTLPVVADIEALPGACAVLTLADGSRVTVGPSDRASMTPPSPEDVGLLTRWDKGPEASSLYRVPAALSGRMAWALGCRPHFAPRLTAIHQTPDAVTFTAMQGGSCAYTLTVPRWALMLLSRPLPRPAGMPVDLTITDQQKERQGAAPSRVFFFEVYPDSTEGAACLEALGMSERVAALSGEGEGQ